LIANTNHSKLRVMLIEMADPRLAAGQPRTTLFSHWVRGRRRQRLAACSVSWKALSAMDKHCLFVSGFGSWQSLLHQGADRPTSVVVCSMFMIFELLHKVCDHFHLSIRKW